MDGDTDGAGGGAEELASPRVGDQLDGVRKGRGMMMFDAAGYIYTATEHEPNKNLKRYKCLLANCGELAEFGLECSVTLTTTHIGNIIEKVNGEHNHMPQRDIVEVRQTLTISVQDFF